MCTLIPRKIWKDGMIARNKDDYAGWAATVAKEENVPLIDLNELIAARYDALGPEKVEPLFGDPHTHTSRSGAELNAEILVEGLKALAENPLEKFLSEKGKGVAAISGK
jgi:lysophospholipase L1-like esterase